MNGIVEWANYRLPARSRPSSCNRSSTLHSPVARSDTLLKLAPFIVSACDGIPVADFDQSERFFYADINKRTWIYSTHCVQMYFTLGIHTGIDALASKLQPVSRRSKLFQTMPTTMPHLRNCWYKLELSNKLGVIWVWATLKTHPRAKRNNMPMYFYSTEGHSCNVFRRFD